MVETPEIVEALVSSGATLLDVRNPADFEAGHIPGARSCPLSDLLADPFAPLAGVDVEDLVVVYDDGGEGSASKLAARALQDAGFPSVRRYGGGFIEWSASGRKVD